MNDLSIDARNILALTGVRPIHAAYLHTWAGAELARYARPRMNGLTLTGADVGAPIDLTVARVSTVIAGATHTVLTLSLPQARTLTLLVEYPAA
jgi:hypothetical protein